MSRFAVVLDYYENTGEYWRLLEITTPVISIGNGVVESHCRNPPFSGSVHYQQSEYTVNLTTDLKSRKKMGNSFKIKRRDLQAHENQYKSADSCSKMNGK